MKNLLTSIILTTLTSLTNTPINQSVYISNIERYETTITENPDATAENQKKTYYSKTNFNISSVAYFVEGVQYSYIYTEGNKTKIQEETEWFNSHEETPRQITFLRIQNYYPLSWASYNLYYNYYDESNGSYNDYFQNYIVYYSTNKTCDTIYDNSGWMNKSYFDNCYNQVRQLQNTETNSYGYGDYYYGEFELQYDENDKPLKPNQFYLIIFEYIDNYGGSTEYINNSNGYYLQIQPTSFLNTSYVLPDGTIKQEVIPVAELMFTILTMPFSFISQAFNLTIFPNTQYSINISNLFLSIIGILIFIFLLKLVIQAIGK